MPKTAQLVFWRSESPNQEPYTTTDAISAGTGIARRKIKDVIKKYRKDFESLGVLASYQAETNANKEGGRKALAYRLNEQQATFLMTLLKNTPVVVAFKKELVRQFYAMRSLLLERNSPIWQDTRELTKAVRKQETDVIRELVEYATAQGSTHAVRYYTSISRLANKTAGITDRDLAHVEQLSGLMLVERIIAEEIRAGIAAGKPYKQIYTDLQTRLSSINALLIPAEGAQALLTDWEYKHTTEEQNAEESL